VQTNQGTMQLYGLWVTLINPAGPITASSISTLNP